MFKVLFFIHTNLTQAFLLYYFLIRSNHEELQKMNPEFWYFIKWMFSSMDQSNHQLVRLLTWAQEFSPDVSHSTFTTPQVRDQTARDGILQVNEEGVEDDEQRALTTLECKMRQ